MSLTDVAVRKAKPALRDYKMADGKGLSLLVRANGAKLWRFRYRYAGKEKMISLGAYPEVSISEARERLDTARKQVRSGRDPSLENRRAALERRSAAAASFEVMAREWHDLNTPRWTKVHARNVLHSLERDVFPKLGRFPLGEIDAPLLLEILRPIERRGAIETARRIRQRISMIFRMPCRWVGQRATPPLWSRALLSLSRINAGSPP